MPIHDRAQLINRFADGIEARMAELYELETMNNGRPITETKAQITRLPEWYRYNAALLLADRDLGGTAARRLPRLHQPVPARRRRHPVVVQPPDDDRVQESRPGLGDRKHRGAQAFRADAADRADARRDRSRGRHPRRGAQRRPRTRPDGGRGADRTPTGQEGRLHRRHRTRPGHRDRDRASGSPRRRWSWAARRRS